MVVEVGPAVTRFSPGDEVFGISNGSFAPYAAAAEDKLALKPANLSFEQAAVAAVSGITALQALTDIGKLQPGERVLVLGASGGVGTYAVQLAKELGARVTGVASTSKLDFVTEAPRGRETLTRHYLATTARFCNRTRSQPGRN